MLKRREEYTAQSIYIHTHTEIQRAERKPFTYWWKCGNEIGNSSDERSAIESEREEKERYRVRGFGFCARFAFYVFSRERRKEENTANQREGEREGLFV